MALACGVSTLLTAILNSLIISGVISLTSTPRADGQRLLQAAALVHGGGGDDAALVGKRLHALRFSF